MPACLSKPLRVDLWRWPCGDGCCRGWWWLWQQREGQLIRFCLAGFGPLTLFARHPRHQSEHVLPLLPAGQPGEYIAILEEVKGG